MRTPATVGLLVTFHCTFAFVPTRTARTLGVSWTNPVDPFTLNANAKSSTSMKIYATNKNPVQSFFDGILKKNSAPKEAEPEKPKIPDAVIKEDYKLGIVFALIGAVIFLLFPCKCIGTDALPYPAYSCNSSITSLVRHFPQHSEFLRHRRPRYLPAIDLRSRRRRHSLATRIAVLGASLSRPFCIRRDVLRIEKA